jgi:hypothetical protein
VRAAFRVVDEALECGLHEEVALLNAAEAGDECEVEMGQAVDCGKLFGYEFEEGGGIGEEEGGLVFGEREVCDKEFGMWVWEEHFEGG